MRYAILGDIHGNLEALSAVREDIDAQSVDAILCLGDIVGYGADPEACVTVVREAGWLSVSGNHDHAAVGRLDISLFNHYARASALWTAAQLSEASIDFLLALRFTERLPGLVLTHGSLVHPENYNYIQTIRDAEQNFRALDAPVCFCGHSHVPLTFFAADPISYTIDTEIRLDPEIPAVVNAGSVGQPRDEQPQASYAVYDEDARRVEIRRIDYDIDTAANKITAAGLPGVLAQRLWLGK
jgi:predicted phosphodiesterase